MFCTIWETKKQTLPVQITPNYSLSTSNTPPVHNLYHNRQFKFTISEKRNVSDYYDGTPERKRMFPRELTRIYNEN